MRGFFPFDKLRVRMTDDFDSSSALEFEDVRQMV
jgi:hypothetical protein